jgi:hypothetical protein
MAGNGLHRPPLRVGACLPPQSERSWNEGWGMNDCDRRIRDRQSSTSKHHSSPMRTKFAHIPTVTGSPVRTALTRIASAARSKAARATCWQITTCGNSTDVRCATSRRCASAQRCASVAHGPAVRIGWPKNEGRSKMKREKVLQFVATCGTRLAVRGMHQRSGHVPLRIGVQSESHSGHSTTSVVLAMHAQLENLVDGKAKG